MNSFPNLKKLTSTESPTYLLIRLDEAIGSLCQHGEALGNLTKPQRTFFLNQSFEKEVNNGGLRQYFANSSGNYAIETIESLRAIGADKTATILQSAIDEFPGAQVPQDRTRRLELLEGIELTAGAAWDSLDEQFYKYDDDLTALNIEYIKAHKDSIW